MIEPLPSRHEALSSNPSTTKRKRKIKSTRNLKVLLKAKLSPGSLEYSYAQEKNVGPACLGFNGTNKR
jgi:hypothetical protein